MSTVSTDPRTERAGADVSKDAKDDGAKGAGKDKTKKNADKAKKSKKKPIIIVVVVMLVGGFVAKSILLKPYYKPGQTVPLGLILPLDQLTVNMADGHLVQASISLQLTKVASKAMANEVPRFDDAAITVLGAETYDQLLAPGGRAAAKAEILALCQKIAPRVDGYAQQVSNIYFTSFVVQ